MSLRDVCPDQTEVLRMGAFLVDRLLTNFDTHPHGWKNEMSVGDVVLLKEWLDMCEEELMHKPWRPETI